MRRILAIRDVRVFFAGWTVSVFGDWAMFIGTIGCSLAVLPIALSSVRNVEELPTAPEDMPVIEEALLPAEAAGLSPEGPSA